MTVLTEKRGGRPLPGLSLFLEPRAPSLGHGGTVPTADSMYGRRREAGVPRRRREGGCIGWYIAYLVPRRAYYALYL